VHFSVGSHMGVMASPDMLEDVLYQLLEAPALEGHLVLDEAVDSAP